MTDFLRETIDLLRRTPEVLRDLLVGLPDTWTETSDTDGGWRPRDVVGHLITAELTDWLERTNRILEHGTSKAFDTFDRFAMLDRDTGIPLDQLVAQFGALRADNLRKLELLVSEEDLDKRGLHPSLGQVSLRELLATWAVHDLDHVSQVFAGMAGSYDDDVGPWKAYLGILLRRDDAAAAPA